MVHMVEMWLRCWLSCSLALGLSGSWLMVRPLGVLQPSIPAPLSAVTTSLPRADVGFTLQRGGPDRSVPGWPRTLASAAPPETPGRRFLPAHDAALPLP